MCFTTYYQNPIVNWENIFLISTEGNDSTTLYFCHNSFVVLTKTDKFQFFSQYISDMFCRRQIWPLNEPHQFAVSIKLYNFMLNYLLQEFFYCQLVLCIVHLKTKIFVNAVRLKQFLQSVPKQKAVTCYIRLSNKKITTLGNFLFIWLT